MATIKLNSIHCERLQDSISEDEIEVRVAGTAVAGPLGVHKDGTVTLGGISRTFTGTVSVQLVELDGNHTPDNLGTHSVNEDRVTGVNLIFDQAKHAYYTLNYTVS
jgi:hypothetical protein